MNKFELMKAYIEEATGKPLENMRPVPLSGLDATEALWPLNDRFRKHLHQIRTLDYNADFAVEADRAIEMLLTGESWEGLSPGAWRVLLERHQQGMVVALANQHAGNPLMQIPSGLTKSQTLAVVALFLLHGMKLPWPPEDRSGFAIPTTAAPGSMSRH